MTPIRPRSRIILGNSEQADYHRETDNFLQRAVAVASPNMAVDVYPWGTVMRPLASSSLEQVTTTTEALYG